MNILLLKKRMSIEIEKRQKNIQINQISHNYSLSKKCKNEFKPLSKSSKTF
jgi:hypothetical protein